MGFRLRKRIKIAPGLHINLSAKRGISATVGVKGVSHNIGMDGRRSTTVSAPGTGLSHVTQHRRSSGDEGSGARALIVLILIAAAVGWLILH